MFVARACGSNRVGYGPLEVRVTGSLGRLSPRKRDGHVPITSWSGVYGQVRNPASRARRLVAWKHPADPEGRIATEAMWPSDGESLDVMTLRLSGSV